MVITLAFQFGPDRISVILDAVQQDQRMSAVQRVFDLSEDDEDN